MTRRKKAVADPICPYPIREIRQGRVTETKDEVIVEATVVCNDPGAVAKWFAENVPGCKTMRPRGKKRRR